MLPKCTMLWIISIFIVAFEMTRVGGSFTLRLRLHTGNQARLQMNANATLSDVHNAIKTGGFYSSNETDEVYFSGKSYSVEKLATSKESLQESGLVSGDLLVLKASTSKRLVRFPLMQTRISGRIQKRGKRPRGSVAQLRKERSELLRIDAYDRGGNVTVLVDVLRSGLVLERIARTTAKAAPVAASDALGGVALLLGRTRLTASGAWEVTCEGAVEVASPASALAALAMAMAAGDRAGLGQTGVLTETSQFLVRQTLRLAGLLGLQVVGCALGSLGLGVDADSPSASESESEKKRHRGGGGGQGRTSVGRNQGGVAGTGGYGASAGPGPGAVWGSRHVRLALELLPLCNVSTSSEEAQRFVVLSDPDSQDGAGPPPTPSLHMEAHRLSAAALALHARGQFTPPSEADPTFASHPHVVQLNAPVLLGGGRETSLLDALLLAVPLPVLCAEAGAAAGLGQHAFPSPLQMQEQSDAAETAQSYLKSLLRDLLGDALDEGSLSAHAGPFSARTSTSTSSSSSSSSGESSGTDVTWGRRTRRQRDLARRLLDPHLLLYLALLVGDVGDASADSRVELAKMSPMALLCAELRQFAHAAAAVGWVEETDAGEAEALSMEALAVLGAAQKALR